VIGSNELPHQIVEEAIIKVIQGYEMKFYNNEAIVQCCKAGFLDSQDPTHQMILYGDICNSKTCFSGIHRAPWYGDSQL